MDVFNYDRKIISYKGREYPFREVFFYEYASEVIVSTVKLSSILFDSKGIWSDSTAEHIDNKIIFYVDENEIKESDNYLQHILKTNIL